VPPSKKKKKKVEGKRRYQTEVLLKAVRGKKKQKEKDR